MGAVTGRNLKYFCVNFAVQNPEGLLYKIPIDFDPSIVR